jgi:DNA gyrase subunit A
VYVKHNIECLVRESTFDLNKAQERKEIVDGLLRALEDIDNIITLIKKSESAAAARVNLISKYGFTENQAKAIVDMKLGKLAGLEKIELQNEAKELNELITSLIALLASTEQQEYMIRKRLMDFVAKHGDKRKTELAQIEVAKDEKEIELVAPEECVVFVSQSGDVKRIPATAFKLQKRNGKGVKSEDDAILSIISTNTIDTLMIFTDKGKMYRLLVDGVPVGTNASKGVRINTLVNMEPDEKVIAATSLYRKEKMPKYVVFNTKQGLFKKTLLEEYMSVKRSTGIQAIKLKEGDSIANVTFCDEEEFIIVTKQGMSIRFETASVAPIGRVTSGVKSIKLSEGDEVLAGLPIHKTTDQLAVFTKAGYGKKTALDEFPVQGRGGKGLKCSGDEIIGTGLVSDEDNILLVGVPNSICFSAKDIPLIGRVSMGNAMIKNSIIKKVVKL